MVFLGLEIQLEKQLYLMLNLIKKLKPKKQIQLLLMELIYCTIWIPHPSPFCLITFNTCFNCKSSKHLTTTSTHISTLIGTYELKEIQAPEGYLLNETIYTLTVNKDQTTTQVVVNEEPRGEINLTKEINTDKTDGKLGDAYLQGNEYTLKAKEKIKYLF